MHGTWLLSGAGLWPVNNHVFSVSVLNLPAVNAKEGVTMATGAAATRQKSFE